MITLPCLGYDTREKNISSPSGSYAASLPAQGIPEYVDAPRDAAVAVSSVGAEFLPSIKFTGQE